MWDYRVVVNRWWRCAFGVSTLGLVFGCGGRSVERDSEAVNGGRAGVSTGGSSGVTGGSSAQGGQSGSIATGGASLGGTAGSTGGAAGSSIRPPACDEGEPITLTSDEVAGRLSRLFFRQEPSDELLQRARIDGLATTAAVGCLAREMLADPRADAGIRDFFDGWLDLGVHAPPAQDPAYVPEFSAELLARAKEASLWYATFRTRYGGTFTELLTDRFVPADNELAPLYVVPPRTGRGFELVEPDHARSGIFTHLYFLMRRSTRAHGSPTQRGLGLASMLGCQDVVLPPVDLREQVPTEFEGTTRSWYETALESEVCQGCHELLTTAGYAFEHFDVLGRYRDVEAGQLIDASAQLVLLESGPVKDHAEAMRTAASSSIARQCFAEHWVGYAASSVHGARAYAVPGAGFDESAAAYVAGRASFVTGFDLREMFVAGVEVAPFYAPFVEP